MNRRDYIRLEEAYRKSWRPDLIGEDIYTNIREDAPIIDAQLDQPAFTQSDIPRVLEIIDKNSSKAEVVASDWRIQYNSSLPNDYSLRDIMYLDKDDSGTQAEVYFMLDPVAYSNVQIEDDAAISMFVELAEVEDKISSALDLNCKYVSLMWKSHKLDVMHKNVLRDFILNYLLQQEGILVSDKKFSTAGSKSWIKLCQDAFKAGYYLFSFNMLSEELKFLSDKEVSSLFSSNLPSYHDRIIIANQSIAQHLINILRSN